MISDFVIWDILINGIGENDLCATTTNEYYFDEDIGFLLTKEDVVYV